MNAVGTRVAAYVLAVLIACVPVLVGSGRALFPHAPWREPLQRAEATLAGGDARRAEEIWQEAHRAAMRSRAPQGALDVGRAYLRIGEAARDRQTAVAGARRLFLVAFFQARERRDLNAATDAAEAFATLGDREMADRAFAVALVLAEQNRNGEARNRIAALRARSSAER